MLRIFAIVLTVSACSVVRAQDFAPVSAEEREALIALFNSTDGPSWKNRAGWLGPEGSECDWHGVTCGLASNGPAPRYNVWALKLQENNLRGSLPPEMSNLQDLEQLFLWGNRLTGSLPTGLRDRWLAGPLRLIGYASQFTAQVTEITLIRRSVAQCGDMVATIRTNATASSRTEKCRERRQKVDVFCEVRSGRTNLFAQDVDRLVYFMEASGFFALQSEYWRSMTHGGTTQIEVVRAGERIRVVNYGAFGPQQLWMAERLLQGILDETAWEDVREIRDCGFTHRDL